MGFVKTIKNPAYFKRFQVKYRRRREGKTDYGARRNMCKQARDKYNAAKYRLIARFTNTKVIAQVAYATLVGDKILASAESTELGRYGIKVGLKNYAAAYCTGLLLARRTLNMLGMDKDFTGEEEITGEEYHIEEEEYEGDKRPFKVILDVGLKRTTIGSKVFGVLKGAADGGFHIPHNTKKFPGYKPGDTSKDEGEYDAEFHKDRIFGAHVSEYMSSLEEEDEQEYKKLFSKYVEEGIEADDMEEMYKKAHEAIREDPTKAPKKEFTGENKRHGHKITCDRITYTRKLKLNKKERKNRVAQRIRYAGQKAAEA